jgi:alpha-L-rhamnosidase
MKAIITSALLFLGSIYCIGQVKVANTICENLGNPIGVGSLQPSLSWQLISTVRNTMQTAYEIKVALSISDLQNGKNLLWSTGKISTDKSLHVQYAGNALQSAKKYYWQVRVWDNHEKVSA